MTSVKPGAEPAACPKCGSRDYIAMLTTWDDVDIMCASCHGKGVK